MASEQFKHEMAQMSSDGSPRGDDESLNDACRNIVVRFDSFRNEESYHAGLKPDLNRETSESKEQ